MNKIRGKLDCKGFSLIEMLVAMAIFVLFTGILLTSYMGVVKALNGAEEYRILYAESRHVFDVLTDRARNATIFTDESVDFGNGAMNELSFYSKDGLSKVTFKHDKDGRKLIMKEGTKWTKDDGDFVEKEVELHSDEISVADFNFYVWPLKNPFLYKNYDDLNSVFHPKVTFSATFEKDSPKGDVFELDLQTSVSLRIYN